MDRAKEGKLLARADYSKIVQVDRRSRAKTSKEKRPHEQLPWQTVIGREHCEWFGYTGFLHCGDYKDVAQSSPF
jgi:hypothetical protein